MNLLLLLERDRVGGERFRIADGRFRHAVDVLEVAVGASLRVGLADGPVGTGRVAHLSADHLELEVEWADPPPRPFVDLVVAVPRPKSLRRLLRDATAMGVRRFVFMRTWRVDKSYLGSAYLRPEGYLDLLHEGLMQARDTWRPEVTIEPRFRPFVEDRAPELARHSTALVAHPDAPRRLADLDFAADEPVTLAVGPEGGFIPYEIEALKESGFTPVSLGPRILRVEVACVAGLAQILARRG